ncbi:hypothetical protein [Streptomyces sp. CBMA370]|uniref:hypothetical protein n=1 Tax=Streptomyces sp. CBMA370 TaxID=1930278 RepID=UPI00166196EC|nr:hypothetical protein [Streptomyces sp. CBMA370]MBD0716209.1 hypothetical protein [Streptomyces sp. CBMA370]
MRAIHVASAALLGAAVVAVAAPAAPADDGGHDLTSFGFSVTPERVAPGGTITLMAEGCEVPTVTVTSGVFETLTLTEGRPGTATVDHDAKADTQYEITFDCKGEHGTARVTVTQGEQPGHHPEQGGHQPQPPEHRPEHDGAAVPPEAHKGVKAGYGTATPSEGLGVTELVTGGLLIAGALGAAVVLTRRRAGGRV